jgi:transcription elongation GreA/GreB family factor
LAEYDLSAEDLVISKIDRINEAIHILNDTEAARLQDVPSLASFPHLPNSRRFRYDESMAGKNSVSKAELLQEIRAQLEREIALITQAARAAHEAATHEESKAEDQHDTRGLESSYLAGAQAQRAAEIQQTLSYYRQLEPRTFRPTDLIAPGALVELDSGGKKAVYFLAPQGGGMKVSIEGKSVQIITPHSPLGEELVGRKQGDTIEVEGQGPGGVREYEITGIG